MATDGPVRGCYLIHFTTPYRHARHYLGWSNDIESRIKAHRQGSGARLMQVITQAGITWNVVRRWEGVGREKERSLKRNNQTWELCPVCKAERRQQQ